jgi:hypothetical protein
MIVGVVKSMKWTRTIALGQAFREVPVEVTSELKGGCSWSSFRAETIFLILFAEPEPRAQCLVVLDKCFYTNKSKGGINSHGPY